MASNPETPHHQLRILLDKVGIIDFKFRQLQQEDRFNLFTILRREHDEENLHSRFLAELLDPNGTHGCKSQFLERFLQLLDMKDPDVGGARVLREHKNIDILIRINRHAVVIENKIFAYDQNKQLERYYEAIHAEGRDENDITLCYLTLDGRAPSANSRGNRPENKIECLSYSDHILPWLRECGRVAAHLPAVRESIFQYENLVKKLTGNTMEEKEKTELIQLLSEGDNVVSASRIVQSWESVRVRAELLYWQELESVIEALSEDFRILDLQKYSRDLIANVTRRGHYPWYGLMFPIDQFGEFRVCCLLERGYGTVYFGLTTVKDNVRCLCDYPKASQITQWLINKGFEPRNPSVWLGISYLAPAINFGSFCEETTLRLIESVQREKTVRNHLDQILELVESYRQYSWNDR